MAAKAASLPRDAYPAHILFAERDGIYWLRGDDLKRADKVLNLAMDGAEAVGVDHTTFVLYASELATKGRRVGVLRGTTVRLIQLRQAKKPGTLPCRAIDLAPELLVGKRELERLERHLGRKRSSLRAVVEDVRTALDHGNTSALGTLYVYRVADDLYEVDWELTTIPAAIFEALAVVAHQSGRRLSCQLVLPKARRGKKVATSKLRISVDEPVTYGQLSLPLF